MRFLLKLMLGILITAAALSTVGSMFGSAETVSTPTVAASPTPKWEQPSPDSLSVPKVRVPLRPKRVVLNFSTRKMLLDAWVPRSAIAADGTVFLWAYFTNPGFTDGSWSDWPIRARASGAGDSVRVVVTARNFGWSTNSAVPRKGYFAWAFAGPDSARLPLYSRYRVKGQGGTPVAPR